MQRPEEPKGNKVVPTCLKAVAMTELPDWWQYFSDSDDAISADQTDAILEDTTGAYDWNLCIRVPDNKRDRRPRGPTFFHDSMWYGCRNFNDAKFARAVAKITDLATLNARNDEGETPLIRAILLGKIKTAKALLARVPIEVELHPERSVQHCIRPDVEAMSVSEALFWLDDRPIYQGMRQELSDALEAAEIRDTAYNTSLKEYARSIECLPKVLFNLVAQYFF